MAEQTTTAFDLAFPQRPRRRLPFYVDVLRRLVREKPLGLVGGIIVLIFFVLAAFSPILAPSDPNALGQFQDRLLSPSLSHPFGTDNLARDVFSRVIVGARVSIIIGFSAITLATILSLLLGVLSGYFGGYVDMIFQRFVDAFIAFPALVFLLAAVAMFAEASIPGLPKSGVFATTNVVLILALGVLFGVGQSRIIRGAVLSVKSQTYILAARATGAGNTRLIFAHVVPNVMAPVITLATLGLGNAILAEATLSFLGLGVTPDTPTWGGMLNREARTYMTQGWWLAIFPGAALSLAVFGFNMLGDALRDLLDPRLRTGA
ncbi:MAG: ABC transporter permease [Dehalococcoidia bacterium]